MQGERRVVDQGFQRFLDRAFGSVALAAWSCRLTGTIVDLSNAVHGHTVVNVSRSPTTGITSLGHSAISPSLESSICDWPAVHPFSNCDTPLISCVPTATSELLQQSRPVQNQAKLARRMVGDGVGEIHSTSISRNLVRRAPMRSPSGGTFSRVAALNASPFCGSDRTATP